MTYMGQPYYPRWLDDLADDVTGEGAFMGGAAHGAEAVHSIVTHARRVYEDQELRRASWILTMQKEHPERSFTVGARRCNATARRGSGLFGLNRIRT